MSREQAKNMAQFLEERGNFPDQVQVNQYLQEVLAPQPGENILEAGSGSGILCRLVASMVVPGGRVTGLELSPYLVEEASQYAESEGMSELISFEVGNAESMPFESGRFDGSFAARLLMHSPDPDAIVRELTRVVRPGGRVVLMDWDFETAVVDHPAKEITRRILNWRTDNRDRNSWSGRQLWNKAKWAGLQALESHPFVSLAYDENNSLTQSLWRAAEEACSKGAISEEARDAWLADLKARIDDGTFFASIVYFLVKGICP
jgi:ubiquinone/menaquinone biosynthesis C-methylase UbiE